MTAIYAKNYGIIELPTLIEMLEYCLDVSARKSFIVCCWQKISINPFHSAVSLISGGCKNTPR
jgi:hypothetical protein